MLEGVKSNVGYVVGGWNYGIIISLEVCDQC